MNALKCMTAAALVAVLTSVSFPARASTVVFNSFGSGDSFDSTHNYAAGGSGVFQAFLFSPSSSGLLSSISVALGRAADNTTATEFDLYTGTASAIGSLLETFLVPNNTTTGVGAGEVVTFSSVLHPVLVAGQDYWLSFSTPGAGSSLWYFSQTGGTRITSAGYDGPGTLPAFRVEADVPLPPAAPLFSSGLGVLGFLGWRKKRKAERAV